MLNAKYKQQTEHDDGDHYDTPPCGALALATSAFDLTTEGNKGIINNQLPLRPLLGKASKGWKLVLLRCFLFLLMSAAVAVSCEH